MQQSTPQIQGPTTYHDDLKERCHAMTLRLNSSGCVEKSSKDDRKIQPPISVARLTKQQWHASILAKLSHEYVDYDEPAQSSGVETMAIQVTTTQARTTMVMVKQSEPL